MSRNASGVYTLPTGNPVSAGTTIEATWANTTLSDIGTEITNSLSRTGAGGMTAALRLADGSSSVPGLAWGNETGSGFYRAGTSDTRLVIATAEVQKWTASGTNVTGALTVSGNTTLGDASGDTTTITGTAVSTPNGLNIDSNTLVVDATNDRIGVGTASPAVKLDINGDVSIPLSNNLTWGGAYGAGTPAVAGTANGLQFYPAGSTSGESMRLTTAGDLGIGTSSPAYKLDVVGSARFTNAEFIYFNNSSGTAKTVLGYFSDNNTYLDAADGAINFRTGTGTVERMRLDASGNLGIGTSSPVYKLDVLGAVGDLASFRQAQVLWKIGTTNLGNGEIYFDAYPTATPAAKSAYIWRQGSSESMRLDSSGNLGLGVTPSAWDATGAGGPVLQIKRGLLFGADTETQLIHNAYYGTGDFRYIASSVAATRYQQQSGQHRWFTAPSGTAGNAITFTQAMTLDAVGTLTVKGIGSGNGNLIFDDPGTAIVSAQGTGASFLTLNGRNAITFTTGGTPTGTERARITSGGEFLIGAVSLVGGAGDKLQVDASGTSVRSGVFRNSDTGADTVAVWNSATTGDNKFIQFYTEAGATVRGNITYNRSGGLVAYNTTSDYRAKDIIGPVANPGATIDALKVYEGQMKGATQSRPMLVAHEAQAVAPYSVTGEKDAVNDDGTPKYQQMDVSSLVPLLIAEIQSLRARVAALEA